MPFHEDISRQVLDFFAPWLAEKADGTWFFLSENGIPGVVEPVMVRQHFLFYDTTDTLCFAHLHPRWLQRLGSSAFSAIGLQPTTGLVQALKQQLPNARIIGVFDDDLAGKVLDCKIALWLMGRDANFLYHDGLVTCDYRELSFRVDEAAFSLHRFRTLTGLRSTYRTIKPLGFTSFRQMFDHTIQSNPTP